MNRKPSVHTLIAMAALTMGSALAFAHNGIEHIMGTVTAVTGKSISVETVQHSSVTVMVDPSTTFTHKGVKASLKDLKAGERVAINAKEGADKKLQGIAVKWGADSSAPAGHGDRQTWSGQISDSMCGADHSAMGSGGKKVDPHDCTLMCVKGGSKFVFVSNGKIFNLATHDLGDLSAQAGHSVQLTGVLEPDGKTVTVAKVEIGH